MKAVLLSLMLLVLCTGCWDMKDINSLAIVSLAGVDKDPKTGELLAYYQVMNPTGLSTRTGSSAKAAVYTYNFKDFSHGRFTVKTGMSMPRIFFTAHLQSYIISERYARQGIMDLLNYIELNPERRANITVYVSDSPLNIIMNSFTTLDRVPGRFIRSLTNHYERNFKNSVYPIRFKDLDKEMNHHTPTIIPIIHYNGTKPSSTSNEVEKINATQGGMSFHEGAVFIHSRMVGRIDEKSKVLFYILNKNYHRLTDTITVNGSFVDVEAQRIDVKRTWNADKSQLTINIRADLRIINNQQQSKLTLHNSHEMEEAFNRFLEGRAKQLEQLGKDKGWDLLGIQDNGGREANWRQTEVTFHVHSTMKTTGNMSTPYLLE
ncbi:Ger(x)C family spore germination C-terminal domain-containing protein [Paenibacillus sp. NPDC056579]|uniref:Ger(x)C family spore germination protein n=1 Tax=Paenibacillus sp. NPDC056579 TaxID=3345871 RepID=UPI003684FD37